MRKNKTMYNKLKANAQEYGIEIIEIDECTCKFKCLECGAIKTNTLNSMQRQLKQKATMHTEHCSKYYNDIIEEELGAKRLKQFRGFYRYARERCCNPNNKDFVRYQGKFKFKDFTEYATTCLDAFKESCKNYEDGDLSIDRIDNSKGYQPGNIRFIPMHINAKNKDAIYPVMAVNIHDKTIIECDSLTEMANKYFEGKTTSVYEAVIENRLYKNTWKIFYTTRTLSTTETIAQD